jgi:hypothetical protein
MARNCDGCTMCCEGWLAIDSNGIRSSLNKPCVNLSCNVGCNIYAKKPADPCGNFKCLWLIDAEHMNPEMKPSITKVIVQERIIQGWHLPVLAAVATNKESLDLQWENIKSIATEKGIFAVALAYSNNKKDQDRKTMNIFGNAEFAATMKTLFDNQVVIF